MKPAIAAPMRRTLHLVRAAGLEAAVSVVAVGSVAGAEQAPEKVLAWTPSRSGVAAIQTCGTGTHFDTVLNVRSGSCTSRGRSRATTTPAAAARATAVRTRGHHVSRVTPTVTAGHTYDVVVDGYADSCGAFRLTGRRRAEPRPRGEATDQP